MATLSQIRDRILTKYQSLHTQREKLEFLYQVLERLRTVHNNKGADFEAGTITQDQWNTFKTGWLLISEKVNERIAILREKVFTEDYGMALPTLETETGILWSNKKQELKDAVTYQNDINTIWQ